MVWQEKMMAEEPIPIWKTIKVGGFQNADSMQKALEGAGFYIHDFARKMLAKVPFSAEAGEIDLVVVSVERLGLKPIGIYEQICQRAKQLGLALCPAEVAPQLRLQYNGQPPGENLVVATELIIYSDHASLFMMERRWLGACGGDDSYLSHHCYEYFVFSLPR
jgi:hypothetical protein